jgi:hypothetical protein
MRVEAVVRPLVTVRGDSMTARHGHEQELSTQTGRSACSKAACRSDRLLAGAASPKQSFMATRTRPGAPRAPGGPRALSSRHRRRPKAARWTSPFVFAHHACAQAPSQRAARLDFLLNEAQIWRPAKKIQIQVPPVSDPNRPAGLLQSCQTASHRSSCFASTKQPLVPSHTRPLPVGRPTRPGEAAVST